MDITRRDLLGSDARATDFTVEVQDDGRAYLRFGDDARGRRPDEGTKFKATCLAALAPLLPHTLAWTLLLLTPGLAGPREEQA